MSNIKINNLHPTLNSTDSEMFFNARLSPEEMAAITGGGIFGDAWDWVEDNVVEPVVDTGAAVGKAVVGEIKSNWKDIAFAGGMAALAIFGGGKITACTNNSGQQNCMQLYP